MKQKLLSIITFLILVFLTQTLSAQNPVNTTSSPIKRQYQTRIIDTVKNTDFSLKGQYQFMLSRSKSLYGNKLINPVRLNILWQSVTDTLRKERVELSKAKTNILDQQKTIANLLTEVSGKETAMNETNAKINEISFLGISFTKGTYNIVVWSIIIVLTLALFIVIARSAKNILEAKHRTQLYDEVSTEYQSYKVKANEKERKLARELQDERNVIEEMKSRGKG
jgi:uncharacterized membrane protein